jgi:hypothetical protein
MFRNLVLLIVGLAIGYFLGFGDAKKHDDHIVKRLVGKAGGAARTNLSNDVDSKLEKSGGR